MNNQEIAFEKLSKLKVGALFMEMGTGKTKVALDLISSKKNKIEYILWICPFSAKNEIEKERQKWHPEIEMEIVGCESIGQSDRVYLNVWKNVSKQKTFMVVDESLKIKNKDSKRAKRIIELGKMAVYKLILNGTPLSKNVLDLWTQMQFLSPKILGMNYSEFKNTYCEYYIRGRLKGLVKKQYNVEHLVAKIRPYIFDSELEIESKKNYKDYYYDIEDMEEYNSLKQEYFSGIDWEREKFDFFGIMTILQQYYCSVESKKEVLKRLLSNIKGQVIIFAKFLKSIPQNAVAITGEISDEKRKSILKDFSNGKFKVLYITYGCGSFSLNFQFCNNIIFLDHTFDYSQRIQAEARIYRIGQKNDVNYYNIWCNCGLERMIQSSLKKKSNLLEEIKKEIQERGAKECIENL